MASLAWSQCAAAKGVPGEEIFENYDVRRADIQAVLELAARSADVPAVTTNADAL